MLYQLSYVRAPLILAGLRVSLLQAVRCGGAMEPAFNRH